MVGYPYDDGQNVRTDMEKECPWCGPQEGSSAPYVQVFYPQDSTFAEARVVCPVCHVATSREWVHRTTRVSDGKDVTRDLVVEAAVAKWNARFGDAE